MTKVSLAHARTLLLAAGACVALFGSIDCKSNSSNEAAEGTKVAEETPATEAKKAEEKAPAPEQTADDEAETTVGDGDLVGRVSRAMIEDQRADWKKLIGEAQPDKQASEALAEVAPGAELTIYFGAWCSDCERELPRMFKAFDLARAAKSEADKSQADRSKLPFTYELIGVDKFFQADEFSQEPLDIPAVPLIIVERDGTEVGRIVEKSPNGIEKDLLSLLNGEKTGQISATR